LNDCHCNTFSKSAADAIATIRGLFPNDLHNRLYLVGGSVRDHVMGHPVCDVDLVTDVPGEQLVELHFQHVQGKSAPPIYFKSNSRFGKLDVTVLEHGQSLEDDLLRRDFRCNAIAMTLDGILIDPLGGLYDIPNKQLIPCSSQSIIDDPIRMFRAFRFESFGWRIAPELDTAIKERSWEVQLATISVERFSREMFKAMSGDSPDIFFSQMIGQSVGRCYLPEIFQMQEVPAGPAKYHGEDSVFTHSLNALRRMSVFANDPVVRLAAFFHDLGKLTTPQEMLPSHIGHDKAGEPFSRAVCGRLKLPASCVRVVAATNALHLVAGRWHELKPTTKLKLARRSLKRGIAPWLPLIVSADRNIDNPMPGWELACQSAGMSATDLGITSEALDEIPPSERQRLIEQFQMKHYMNMITRAGDD